MVVLKKSKSYGPQGRSVNISKSNNFREIISFFLLVDTALTLFTQLGIDVFWFESAVNKAMKMYSKAAHQR